MTLSTIRNNNLNRIFFKNASFHGDTKYVFNEARMELTVHMQIDDLKRKATYRIETGGIIGDLISQS